jgi:hypothetical protein
VLIWLPLKKSKVRKSRPFVTDLVPDVAVIDLRSDLDLKCEKRAKRHLDGDLEQIADLVGRLGHEYQRIGDPKWEQMKRNGEQLNDRGGFELMVLVCLRARELGGRHTSVSAAWDGIGEWQN